MSTPFSSVTEQSSAGTHLLIPHENIKWPNEMALLLRFGRLELLEGDVRDIREVLQTELDWNRFFRLALLHCMTAFIFRHLDTFARDIVPEGHMRYLKNRFLQDGAAALRSTSQLLNLLEMFERNGILVVPYKGPALAVAVYGSVAFRRYNDLDIVVTRKDVPLARKLLEEAGFKTLHPTSPAGREFLLQRRHSEIFTRKAGPIVELHWAFAKQRGLFPLDLEMLRARLSEMKLAGSSVKIFAPEDHLLILCVHGANHLWSRLEWLTGVSELIRGNELDWSEVLSRARELRSIKAVLLGSVLAAELLGAPVPPEVLVLARGNRDVVWAARLVKKKLASGQIERPGERSSVERDLFRLRLQSTNGARFQYLVHRFTTPGREDTRHMLRVGRGFVPLPAFVRPFHVLGKLLGRAVSGHPGDGTEPGRPL